MTIRHSLTLLLLICTLPSAQAQMGKHAKIETTKKVRFAGIPMVNYNRSFGFMYGAMGSMYYKTNRKDTISPSSSAMVMGMYSTSHTYMAMMAHQLYFKEDKWRFKVVAGTGEIFFQYFQDLPNLPPSTGQIYDDGVWIDYTTDSYFLVLDAKRKVFKNFYAGGMMLAKWTSTDFDVPFTEGLPTKNANMISLGYNFLYDSRDHVNYPTKGFFILFKNNFIREALGSTSDYNQFQLAANYFWDITKKQKSILVSRIYTNIAAGDVPFQGQNTIGRDDLRGYSQGEYRGNQVYAVQAELRQNVYKRFGVIGFLGMGAAVDEFSDLGHTELLPSAGFGLRYLMIPTEKINIGIDVGVGKDDWSLAFRIAETFGR